MQNCNIVAYIVLDKELGQNGIRRRKENINANNARYKDSGDELDTNKKKGQRICLRKNCCLDEQTAAAETIRKLQKKKKCEVRQQHELHTTRNANYGKSHSKLRELRSHAHD
jgi:hypothetical protein